MEKWNIFPIKTTAGIKKDNKMDDNLFSICQYISSTKRPHALQQKINIIC